MPCVIIKASVYQPPPPPCDPGWVCEMPLNGYKNDGCGNRATDSACNPPPPSPILSSLRLVGCGGLIRVGVVCAIIAYGTDQFGADFPLRNTEWAIYDTNVAAIMYPRSLSTQVLGLAPGTTTVVCYNSGITATLIITIG